MGQGAVWVYRSPAWKTVRRLVLVRDGFRCQIRGPGCQGWANQVDHIVEIQNGGAPFDLANLQAACRHCNVAKGNQSRGAAPVRSW